VSKQYDELIECGNGAIVDMAMKCEQVFSSHKKAYVAISGGADSDVMMDVCERVRTVAPIDIHYEFTNTGIEYAATKEHLSYLEDRYGVGIRIAPPDRTIPQCVKLYGAPFISKFVSHQISKMQKGGFGWEDEPFDVLRVKYPEIIESALKWWTNSYKARAGTFSAYSIGRNTFLKEFLIEHPPTFNISDKCCDNVKKTPAHRSMRVRSCDLNLVGVRRAEGGIRATKSACFSKGREWDTYKPLNFIKNDDREFYEKKFGISHSDCYEVWGLTRTGCVGCPFNQEVFREMGIVRQYEPNAVKAAEIIFREAYEYTRMYQEFKFFSKYGRTLF
jgi:3'-phosphoadenosine 5'-phosphosulfate sulfotransferase (PAPS reductase)/FAD synthetase